MTTLCVRSLSNRVVLTAAFWQRLTRRVGYGSGTCAALLSQQGASHIRPLRETPSFEQPQDQVKRSLPTVFVKLTHALFTVSLPRLLFLPSTGSQVVALTFFSPLRRRTLLSSSGTHDTSSLAGTLKTLPLRRQPNRALTHSVRTESRPWPSAQTRRGFTPCAEIVSYTHTRQHT